ncbi:MULTISPECIES: FAD-binding oxidoreductase [Actinosynnema]|uniref:FAD-binding oxidoreductase n=1 Tax=Actinosynnema TaxID=40566 RepID=UPI0020A2AC13|nr:FAD-binding protein [Actinosynnema pretiosum]MCP2094786.1 Tat (twin-arginine translocation) pathway signal sequence [Actinosynnema pretiosum]
MSHPSRRSFLGGSAAAGATALLTRAGAPAQAQPSSAPISVLAEDPRYPDLVRGANLRWVGSPDRVHLADSADSVVAALRSAVRAGERVAVRSGGHCYEGFVTDPAVRTVIDLSGLSVVTYDRDHRAFSIAPGATLGDVYRTLFKKWGVTVPGGSCPSVGAGGHIAGGGYGALARKHGLVVDHLHGVEVVVVDRDRRVRKVVATRDAGDPNRELWWAHTGGGGGNFGIVTRYLMRTPGVSSDNPSDLLPKPPSRLLVANVTWPWADFTPETFARLVRNYCSWHERNSAPDSPCTGLFSQLKLFHRSAGTNLLVAQVDADDPRAHDLLAAFLAEINEGVGTVPGGPAMKVNERRELPWLHAVCTWPGFAGLDATQRFKDKSAYLRRGFSDVQIAALHRRLVDPDFGNPASLLLMAGYGGQVNTVAPSATAVPQRDSILKLQYLSFWHDEADDPANLDWVRSLYREVHADTGGVPAPDGAITDGCFVNYADADLGDPALNTSGVPWHRLYYKDNYPRLQRAKAAWDPLGVFRHAQSVELP